MTRCKISLISLVLIVHSVFGQYADNPYLNGYTNDYRPFYTDEQQSYMDIANNPFLSHMISSRAIPGYAAPQYLPPVEKQPLICGGSQYCVNAGLCNGGYFTQGSPSRQNCDSDTEVCCTYRPPPPPPPPPTIRPSTPCSGNNYACVSPNLCQNGILPNGFQKQSSSNKCYAPEVCCRIPEPESVSLTESGYVVRVPPPNNQLKVTPPPPARPPPTRPPPTRPPPPPPVGPSYLPPVKTRLPAQRGEDLLSEPIQPQLAIEFPSACAAAMNCTEVQFCTATGFISKTPVILTKEQEIYRVPLTDCRDSSKGIIGKCCRDPDYTDPWPVSQLGKYDASLFGDDGKYKPVNRASRNSGSGSSGGQRLVRSQTGNPPFHAASSTTRNQIIAQPSRPRGKCATRDFNGSPQGPGPIDASFGEYPWQAMVLLDSTKSLLCGGAIIADDVVATTARCVQGRKAFDVAIKGGEWKLGSNEEPLKFQIIRVRKIEIHPQDDFALLLLDTKLKFDRHISPICIDDTPPAATDECVTTGWGKEALRVHLQDAIMHHSPVSVIPNDGQSTLIYGQTTNDACEVDPGSALACSNAQGQYLLKGVYSKEEGCGSAIVGFAIPDLKWINSIKSGGKSIAKKVTQSYSTGKSSVSSYKASTAAYSQPAVAQPAYENQPSYSQVAYNQPDQYQDYYANYPNYADYYQQKY